MPDYGHQITKLGTLEGVYNNQATEAKYLTMNSNSEAKYQQFKSIAMQVKSISNKFFKSVKNEKEL